MIVGDFRGLNLGTGRTHQNVSGPAFGPSRAVPKRIDDSFCSEVHHGGVGAPGGRAEPTNAAAGGQLMRSAAIDNEG